MKFLRAGLGILLMFALLAGVAQAERLIIAQGQDIVGLNPMKTTAQVNLNAASHIVETLMLFDYEVGGVVPHLATSWERIDDLTMRVELRRDVTFTNGEPFDAEAAKFSLELGMTEPAMSGSLSALDRIEVVDTHTIDVVTQSPYPLLELHHDAQVLFEPKALISGDPNPSNWGVRANGELVPFDWERIGYGHPAIDLAIAVPGLGEWSAYHRVASRGTRS